MPDRRADQDGAASRGAWWFGVLLLALLLASLASFFVAARVWWLPVRASEQAPMVDGILDALFVIGLVFFVAAQVFLAVPLMRRRAAAGPFVPPPLTRMPGIGAIIAVLVLVIADATVLALSERDWFRMFSPPPADALRIEVVGRQFMWQFRYPGPDGRFGRTNLRFVTSGNPFGMDPDDPANAQNVVTVNEMHVVVGRPVVLQITALDVIHSFNLPNFRLKQDAVPGRPVTVWTTPDRAGTYEITCAQLCGVGHYTMRGIVVVQSPGAFAAWMASQRAAIPPAGKPGAIASGLRAAAPARHEASAGAASAAK